MKERLDGLKHPGVDADARGVHYGRVWMRSGRTAKSKWLVEVLRPRPLAMLGAAEA